MSTPCVITPPANIVSFEPFESLSVVRQERNIPMLFGFRSANSIDRAGIPMQNTSERAKVIQVARYAFDTFRTRKASSNRFNQQCLPTTSIHINSNLNRFYHDNRLKNGASYGIGENYITWLNQAQFDAIKNNSSLTPSQKKSQFTDMIYTNMSNLVNTYELDKKYLHYIISNEDWQHSDAAGFPEHDIEQIKIFSGYATPTLAQVLRAQKDYIAECFKAAYDAFPTIASRKFLYFGAYNMEQRATTLKFMLDIVNYINGRYPNVVHGLMMQAHIGIEDFTATNAIEDKLRKIEKLVNVARNSGFEVSIYEFDHKIFDENFYKNIFQKLDDSGNIIRVGVHRVATDADFIRQAQIYKDCVKIFLNQGVCQFQVWDDTDPGSWRNFKYYTHINVGTATAPNWRAVRVGDNVNRYPTSNITLRSEMTLFDGNVRPKPCYNEILSLLKDYVVTDYNSKKSIFPPYNVLNYRYSDLGSMGD